jgi:hypothetical protein
MNSLLNKITCEKKKTQLKTLKMYHMFGCFYDIKEAANDMPVVGPAAEKLERDETGFV